MVSPVETKEEIITQTEEETVTVPKTEPKREIPKKEKPKKETPNSPFVRLITPESDAPFHLVCI